jgi:hypothetical protein
MSVQKIPLDTVQKLRQHIKTTLVLPDSENNPKSWSTYENLEDLPEPELLGDLGELFNVGGTVEEASRAPNNRGKWFVSSSNPGAALLKLPGLTLKPDLRLISYLYRMQDSGIGATWAVPEALGTTGSLEKALADSDRTRPPQPPGALADVMDAVEGDRSAASFIVASILRRELREFGALGKACNWSYHHIIASLPIKVQWQWRIEQPKDLSPKVRLFSDGRAVIEFFTCRTAAPIAVFQHVDQYPANGYKAVSIDRPVAVARQAVKK